MPGPLVDRHPRLLARLRACGPRCSVWPLLAALALGGVFVLYLQPDLLIALDGLVFGCGG